MPDRTPTLPLLDNYMEQRENIFVVFILLTAAFVCYAAVLNAGFIWDDQFLVVENPLIRAPLWSLQVFKQDIINSGFSDTIYYRPLQILSYAVDYRLWGMKAFGFHFTNIFLHFLNGVLVFFLALKLCGKRALAFLVSLIFIVHPAHVGAVSYVSGRADLLCFLFGLSSMLYFVRFREHDKPLYFSMSIICLALSLLSKEIAVVVPFLILLIDVFFPIGGNKIRMGDHVPNFILLGVYAALHHYFFGARYSVVFELKGLIENVMSYLRMLVEFFVLGIAPVNLYMRRFAGGIPDLGLVTALICVCMILLFIYLRKERKPLVFSLIFFAAALLPLMFVIRYFDVLAEHWMYMASFGLFMFMSLFLFYFFSERGEAGKWIFAAISLLAFTFYSVTTIGQNRHWISDESLSDRVLGFSGQDRAAMHYKAVALLKGGSTAKAGEIMKDYVAFNKDNPQAWYIKGRMELASDNVDQAYEDFKTSVELDPGYENGYLGLAFASLYRDDEEKGIEYLERVIQLNPEHSEALVILGAAYSKAGDDRKALLVMEQAKRINPYDCDVLINLGTAYTRIGGIQEGAYEYLQASRLYPEKAMPCYNLAYLFYESGDEEQAVNFLNEALEREPDFKPALELLHKIREKRSQ